jgi:hypothetical protein
MGIPHQLRLRTKKSVSEIPESGSPGAPFGSDGQLEVAVLFTSAETTDSAIKKTAGLLQGLNARINLVAVQAVPYRLAINSPPVSTSFHEQRLEDIASESPIETTAHLYICRSPLETLTSVLQPGSILVVGIRKRWWPTWERRLARKLEFAGLRILLLEVN